MVTDTIRHGHQITDSMTDAIGIATTVQNVHHISPSAPSILQTRTTPQPPKDQQVRSYFPVLTANGRRWI